MTRGLLLTAMMVGLVGMSFAQKPHGQPHHAKPEHKPAPVAAPKAGHGANGADAQLKRLEQQTTKTTGAKQAKQKAPAPVKYKAEPVGAKKNPPIEFKPQHPQAKPAGKGGAPKNTLHARH